MAYKNLYKNTKPLKLIENLDYSKQLINLEENKFPLIEDFQIVIKDCGKYLGNHMYYSSQKYGLIASFPWWDNVDVKFKKMDISDIPLGKIDSPFDDLEQSWQILIWEKDDYVYIVQGEDPCCTEFPIWFKVERQKYIEEWKKILQK